MSSSGVPVVIFPKMPPTCVWRISDFPQKSAIRHTQVLEVDEIKAIPCTPRSHAFVERLIGTVRREYLDRTLFWNQSDLERKLENYKAFYNQYRSQRVGRSHVGSTQRRRSSSNRKPSVISLA